MADNSSAATNKLGQLYIEFGTKGLGGVLTGLNGVSAGFLNTASLAQKAVKTTGEFYKSVGQGAISLQKASVLTNLPIEQLEYLQKFTELNNVSFDDFIGNITKMQQAIKKMGMGEGSPILAGFQLFGLKPSDYDIDKDPLKLFEDIRKRAREIYQTKGGAHAAMGLSYFGMDSEMLQIMVNANKEVDKTLLLGGERLKLYGDEKYALNELGTAWKSMIEKAMSSKDVLEVTKDIVGVLKWINNFQDKQAEKNKNRYGFYEATREFLGNPQFREATLQNMKSALPKATQRMYALKELQEQQAIYNITNNNTFNRLEDIDNIDYHTSQQAQYNHAQNNNNGGRPNAK